MYLIKKVISILVVFGLLFSYVPTVLAASDIPYSFWSLSEKYTNALESSNYEEIIQYGNEIVKLFNGKEENKTKLDIVTPRLEQIAKAYESIGDYENAVKTFELYIPLAKKQGWDEGVTYAESKILALDFDIELYTITQDIENNSYNNAMYEPYSGIYFGSTYDNDEKIGTFDWNIIKKYFPKKNSAYLVYLDWKENISSYDRYFKDAKKNNIGIELAWNVYSSNTIENINEYASYIKSTAIYLEELDIPVFLRFACEMNISEVGNNASKYIEAFQYVSNIIREYAPNVAMVWSPNEISASDRSFEDYYPGDNYVDWVGISSYNFLYFQGKKDWKDMQDTIDSVYFTGDYVNPIKKIKPFIEKYGVKKPVMISETGVGHYAKLENENLTDWAKIQLRRLYIYGPMVYPQLKGIFYFNADSNTISPYNDYALYNSSDLNNLYNELVDSGYYISSIGENANYRYEKILDYTNQMKDITLMTYAIPAKVLEPIIKYYVDNKEISASNELPYTTKIDFSKFDIGNHELKVEICNGTNVLRTKNYNVTVADNNVRIKEYEYENVKLTGISELQGSIQNRLKNSVILYVGKSKTYSNCQVSLVDTNNENIKPFVQNGRTLVPVRFISETLGAIVSWDGNTSTVTLTFDDTVVKLKLNSNIMLINEKEVLLDVPAITYEDRTFIPIRALTEALGKKVFYDRGLIIISDIDNIFDTVNEKNEIDKIIELFNLK